LSIRPGHPPAAVAVDQGAVDLSRDDPIVAARASEVHGGENVTVSGSHSGLAHNKAVFEHLGRFLATR